MKATMKKVLSMLLVVALTAGIAISGTIAYLTSEDSDVNVMTLGNVSIEQHEYERVVDENGNYVKNTVTTKSGSTVDSYKVQEFSQAKPLLPATGEITGWDDTSVRWEQLTDSLLAVGGQRPLAGLNNVQDKFVLVENTGKTDAYVRTLIALEYGSNVKDIVGITTGDFWTWNEIGIIKVDDNNYFLYEAIYKGADSRHVGGVLPAGEYTYNSLGQVYLANEATNEDCEALDGNNSGTYDILVFSQAVQAAGFENADTALDAAFGDITTANHPWLKDGESTVSIVNVEDSEGLKNAIADAKTGKSTTIVLEDGEYATNFKVDGGKNITIIGTKNTVLSGQIATTSSTAGTLTLKGVTVNVDSSIKDSTGISQTGKSAIAIWGNQTVVCDGVTFNMSLDSSTAITSWWDTGVGTSIVVRNCTFNCNGQRPIRATGNVTVENTTFNDPYRYAVQLTAKTSTATLLDKAIINFNNNTIVDGENGKALVYGIQLEGADYGCHDCVINGTGNKIVNDGEESAMYYCECGKVVHDTIEWNTEVDPVHEA